MSLPFNSEKGPPQVAQKFSIVLFGNNGATHVSRGASVSGTFSIELSSTVWNWLLCGGNCCDIVPTK